MVNNMKTIKEFAIEQFRQLENEKTDWELVEKLREMAGKDYLFPIIDLFADTYIVSSKYFVKLLMEKEEKILKRDTFVTASEGGDIIAGKVVIREGTLIKTLQATAPETIEIIKKELSKKYPEGMSDMEELPVFEHVNCKKIMTIVMNKNVKFSITR